MKVECFRFCLMNDHSVNYFSIATPVVCGLLGSNISKFL